MNLVTRFAAPLDFGEVAVVDLAAAQRFGENVGGFDRVGDRAIDADAADRQHDVSGVADQQQARTVPASEPARLDGEQADVVPTLQQRDAVAEPRQHRGDRLSKRFEPVGLDLLDSVPAGPHTRIATRAAARARR